MHDFPPNPVRSFLWIAGVALAATFAWPVHAQTTTAAKQAATQKKLDAVKSDIAALARKQRDTGAERDSINSQLAAQASQLQTAARAVQASDDAIAAVQTRLHALQEQRDAIHKHLHDQRAALADLLRAAYAVGRGSDLRLLLGDADVSRIARALAYSRYFQHDRAQRIHALLGDLSRLDTVQASITQEQQTLQATRGERAQQIQTLTRQRAAQQVLLAQANARLKDQAQRLQTLHDNQKSLSRLLEKLRDVFADLPNKLPADTPFARLRGKLPWPAHGSVQDSGEGVRIKAAAGSAVHAVAHGRVAYADWLRGYGMLLIIDHGDGWMSLYGDNETLARSVGDWVDAGDTIGTASATRGTNAGVYFSLRHHSKPVAPLPWLAGHKN